MKKIPILRKSKVISYALVDDEDYDRIAQFTWRLHSKGYATRSVTINGKEKRLLMHREVLQVDSPQIDHIDKNKLNNTRDNLRPVNNSQNQHNAEAHSTNKCGVRGVYWEAERNCWRAKVMLNGKEIHLGRFKTLDEAEAVVIEWKRSITT